ncbi:MAG: low-specificity L-threonine aldolase [Candidatus Poribacteria bacterium]|nr:low-specificity L-threonine aldolase [Candidatus Poribacteria bacterium]MDE0502844.1 low-specificity L-threonine aldolase [Candidatus Poribacteria bacterium]
MKVIDLRSDTATRPTEGMTAAIAAAELGDDVLGEDPTVNRLEALAAETTGTEAAVFATSGTQSNLLGIMALCQRGDEYIVGQDAHTYKAEGGGAAVLGSIQPQPLDFEPDGTLNLDAVDNAIKPDNFHYARTKLLCLENTRSGIALPLDYLRRAREFTRERNLKLHLDGARVFNAAVKQRVPVNDIACNFDSISFCLSKGLGAPVGSVLCSTTEVVKEARRWRKVLGGGMRQAGILAAAGIFALTKQVDRLEEDHVNAALLAQGLHDMDEVTVDFPTMQTNMVYIGVPETESAALSEFMKEKGILISGGKSIRLTIHLDVSREDIYTIISAFKDFYRKGNA